MTRIKTKIIELPVFLIRVIRVHPQPHHLLLHCRFSEVRISRLTPGEKVLPPRIYADDTDQNQDHRIACFFDPCHPRSSAATSSSFALSILRLRALSKTILLKLGLGPKFNMSPT